MTTPQTTPINSTPYLRNSRSFPDELLQLSTESDKAYVEVARSINDRTIGLYPIRRPSITGNKYYFESQPQQSLRQMYVLGNSLADIPIGFKVSNIYTVANMYGTYTDAVSPPGNIYGFIAGAPNAGTGIAGQILFYIFVDTGSTTTDVIRFVSGAGAPTITSGLIVLEWISNV